MVTVTGDGTTLTLVTVPGPCQLVTVVTVIGEPTCAVLVCACSFGSETTAIEEDRGAGRPEGTEAGTDARQPTTSSAIPPEALESLSFRCSCHFSKTVCLLPSCGLIVVDVAISISISILSQNGYGRS